MNNKHNQASDGEAKAKPELNKLGLDLQARQVTECRQLDGSTPKPAQNNLESYLRGNRDAMSIVAVPSPEQEQRRSVVRHREQLVRNRRRAEARGRAPAPDPGNPGRNPGPLWAGGVQRLGRSLKHRYRSGCAPN